MWISNLQTLAFPHRFTSLTKHTLFKLSTHSCTSPPTHSFTIQRIHLPNHQINRWRPQSLPHSLTQSPTHSLTKWLYCLHMLSVTSPHSHLIAVTHIHLQNAHISYWRSQSLPHTLTQSPKHSLTKWPYCLHILSVTLPHTHLITVTHIHLPNDHNLLRPLSVTSPHTQSITVARVHLPSTQVHTSLLSTQITGIPKPLIPLPTHNHSTSDPPSCSGTHFLACSTTMPLGHRFTCLSSLQNHTTLKPTAILQNVLGCDKGNDVKIPLI